MTRLLQRLRRWAEERPGHIAFAFMPDGISVAETLTYGALDRAAHGIAGSLTGLGARGRPVLVLCEPGADFVKALVGGLYAGAIVTPVPMSQRPRGMARLGSIADNAQPGAVLATVDRFAVPGESLSAVPWLRIDDAAQGADFGAPALSESHPAVIQYTSGSTSAPKGVVLSHGNLAANLRMLHDGFDVHDSSRYLCWLPVFHDMGLIAHLLAALHNGATCWFAPPLSFFRRPETWLRAISHYGTTISGAPNFAYEMCIRRFPKMELDGLSLASWETAFCGAEMVRASTMKRFATLFAPYGLRPSALRPCYGLAEATVFVTAARGVHTLPVMASGLTAPLVSCGVAPPDGPVLVVDPETMVPRIQGEVGEICVAGPHVSEAYWQNPAESAATFNAEVQHPEERCRVLRTGDLGLIHNGELYVTGRMKDTILLRGETIHAEDVEQTVSSSHPDLHGLSAAFSLDVNGAEQVIVVQEIPRSHSSDGIALFVDAAMRMVADVFGTRLYDFVFVRPGAIPRTTSGKVQRARCRALYLSGDLPLHFDRFRHPSLGRNQDLR